MNLFNKLINTNCFTTSQAAKSLAANLLEKLYGCEVNCVEMDKSVLFAHHARGCTIIASKIYENVVIFQNVTIGSNMKYNKLTNKWENMGNPVINKNVAIADGAKILGPVIIGENSVVAAGAIVTKDMPSDSIIYGINRHRPREADYDPVFNKNMAAPKELIAECHKLIQKNEADNHVQ